MAADSQNIGAHWPGNKDVKISVFSHLYLHIWRIMFYKMR